MLYARYGRIGIEMMQAVSRDMGLRQDKESLQMVKAAIASLGDTHPVKSYISIAPDLNFDAGVVDTFLRSRDKSFTVDDCIGLVTSAGLVFQDWFLKAPCFPPTMVEPGNEFYAGVAQLSANKISSVMERVNTLNGCHFSSGHTSRPADEQLPDRLLGTRRVGLFAAVPVALRCRRAGRLPLRLDRATGPDTPDLRTAHRRRTLDPGERREGGPERTRQRRPI